MITIKKLLSKLFVFIAYLIATWVLPFIGLVYLTLWLETNVNRLIVALTMPSWGLLFALWMLISLGIFGYAVTEKE